MINLSALVKVLDMVDAHIDSLTAEQMHNAMVKICRDVAPCYGKPWSEFRAWQIIKNQVVYDPCTKDQLIEFVAHKRGMLNGSV